MDSMVPWLLLVIAGMIVLCTVMHSRLRETESATRGQQSFIADELRDAEAALVSALERLRRMDQELSDRESALSQCQRAPEPVLPPPVHTRSPVQREPGLSSLQRHIEGRDLFSTASDAHSPPGRPAESTPGLSWRSAAIERSRRGMTALQIARELDLPVGEVELVLALDAPGRIGCGSSVRSPDPENGLDPLHRAGRPTRPTGPA
jgi:hypothetical protein